jgi:hypothetical protein
VTRSSVMDSIVPGAWACGRPSALVEGAGGASAGLMGTRGPVGGPGCRPAGVVVARRVGGRVHGPEFGDGDPPWRSQIFQLSECLSGELLVGALSGALGDGRGIVLSAPAAVVSGVVGPVAGTRALPRDGDADVNAEQAGEQRGRELGGELEQCSGAGFSRPQAELTKSLAEVERADRSSGLAAGEQPRGAVLVTDDRVALPGGDRNHHRCPKRD